MNFSTKRSSGALINAKEDQFILNNLLSLEYSQIKIVVFSVDCFQWIEQIIE